MVQPNAATTTAMKRQINKHIARTSHRRLRQTHVDEFQKTHVNKLPEATVSNDVTESCTATADGTLVMEDRKNVVSAPRLNLKSIFDEEYMVPFGHLLSASSPREQFMLRYCESPEGRIPGVNHFADGQSRYKRCNAICRCSLSNYAIDGSRAPLL